MCCPKNPDLILGHNGEEYGLLASSSVLSVDHQHVSYQIVSIEETCNNVTITGKI
jgi:hypothetical protein